MNSLQFNISELKRLSFHLKIDSATLIKLCENLESSYRVWKEVKKDKTTGIIKTYLNGQPKQRTIRTPHSDLKAVQKAILRKILGDVSFPEHVQGAVKGKSNITNAKRHQGNKFIFSVDLKDFYPSISNTDIYKIFLGLGHSAFMSSRLTKLTTVCGELPHGAPTSPCLANIFLLETDYKLLSFIKEHRIVYTRFFDDLVFSSPQDFQMLIPEILRIIESQGHKINFRKVKYKGHQTITGISVFNNYIDAPKKIKIKAEEETTSISKPYTNYYNRIRNTNKNIKR